jgi:tetratricopeptide (TPR) repeat protein
MAAGMTAITIVVEHRQAKSGTPVDVLVRPFVAARALLHYVYKLFWPNELLPIYARWPDAFVAAKQDPMYWLATAVVIIAVLLVWKCRRRIDALSWWALAMFILMLFPMLGFKHFNFLQYSFVSDHFLYLAAPGLFLIIGLLLEKWRNASNKAFTSRNMALAGITALLFSSCVWLTAQQNPAWKNGESFWLHTLQGNPDCFPGNYNLGNYYAKLASQASGATKLEYIEKSLVRYGEAARALPTHVDSRHSCAKCCRQLNRPDDAVYWYSDALTVAARKGQKLVPLHLEFAGYLRQLGRLTDALAEYQAILKKDPSNAAAKQASAELSQLNPAAAGH